MEEKNKIILLIGNDSDEYLLHFSSILNKYRLIMRNSHREGFEFFINNHFDITIVILYHLPDAPSFDLLKYIKLFEPSIPVIIMAEHGSEELASEVFRMGASDYIKTSTSPKELQKSIQKLLNQKELNSTVQRETIYGLYRAMQYINLNYFSNIRLCDVAREAGMSVSCFERTFKKTMGMNFSPYINKLRIEKASDMLRKTNYSVSEIAFACGFTNQFHFTRTFKKILKVSPTVYKKKKYNLK